LGRCSTASKTELKKDKDTISIISMVTGASCRPFYNVMAQTDTGNDLTGIYILSYIVWNILCIDKKSPYSSFENVGY